ncbi:probable 2-(3-amino-3-carboxypropyl)histidine synthase subunit 2 [Coccomyxa sp. Obi]|nr:probable 2-(3-amino-3-carboxypropyl)histidine synthase subunit 2 [Coccomyxa sp. Obi]
MSAACETGSWAQYWDIEGTATYIVSRKYTIITLQFPDDLLKEAKRVVKAVEDACTARGLQLQTFVLADTTYNSLGVDEVAAQHAKAHCVIHYGRASLSPLSSLPAYFVFTRAPLDCSRTADRVVSWAAQEDAAAVAGKRAVVVLPDQPLVWAVESLRSCLTSVAKKAGLGQPFVVADVAARQLDPAPSQPSTSDSTNTHAHTSNTAGHRATTTAAQTVGISNGCCHSSGSSCQEQHAGGSEGVGKVSSLDGSSVPGSWSACCRDAQPMASTCSIPTQTEEQAAGYVAANGLGRSSREELMADDKGEMVDAQPSSALQAENRAVSEGVSSPSRMAAAGLVWELPEGVDPEDCLWLWLGDDDAPALTQLLMTYSRMHWAMYNPHEDSLREGLPSEISRTLRKRNFLIEKAKNSNIIGIVVGTLGVAGYLEAAEQVRKLAHAAGKKTYTILMGKPSPVKLANFPEIDIFVLIADAQGQILDSKEFYAPLITPYEAQLAFTPEGASVSGDYRLDFDALLCSAPEPSTSEQEGTLRFSLVDGGHYWGAAEKSTGIADSTALAEHASRALHVREEPGKLAEVKSAAQYLAERRTFRGLETPYTGAQAKPVVKAIAGRSGRAAQYEDEPAT